MISVVIFITICSIITGIITYPKLPQEDLIAVSIAIIIGISLIEIYFGTNWIGSISIGLVFGISMYAGVNIGIQILLVNNQQKKRQ